MVESDQIGIHGGLAVPAKLPAAPTPAMALPTMKATEFGAAPQIADATSNSATLERNTPLTEYNVYNFPNNSWKAQHVKRYALPYQPTSARELNLSVICGMA